MVRFSGKSVYKGITMGNVVLLDKADCQVKRGKAEDADAEAARVRAAIEQAREQLGRLYDKAVKEVGEAKKAAGVNVPAYGFYYLKKEREVSDEKV